MSRLHLGITCILGLVLGCGPTPDRSGDTPIVGVETRVETNASSLAQMQDHDGEVEVESMSPAADDAPLVVVTSMPVDGADPATDETGVVVIGRAGSAKPLARIACPFVSDVRVDDAGTEVRWIEQAPLPAGGVAHLHTFDVATGVHLRFATDNPSWTTTR